MDVQTFKNSIAADVPPDGIGLALQALWWDAKGDWEKAHDLAQQRDDTPGAHVHAYLHRKEGDQSNANYWYRRAGAPASSMTLAEEWDELVKRFLEPL